MKLPEFGVNRPMASLMLFLAVLLLGAVSYSKLPIDLMPEIESPAISVVTVYPGAAAADVEREVTEVIENELSIVTNLDKITSVSKENISLVSCKFAYGTNLDEASNEMRDNLEFAKRRLPDDIDPPMIFKFNTSNLPIMFLGFTADESWEKLEKIIDDLVTKQLKRVPGVGAVQVFGGLKRQINVYLDRAKMESVGVSIDQVQTLLKAGSLSIPAGSIKVGEQEYFLRVPGEYASVDEIADLEVKLDASGIVYLGDIARVEDGFEEERRKIRIDDRPGMLLFIQKRSGTNTTEVSEAANKELKRIQKYLPSDVEHNVLLDAADFIRRSISNLKEAVLWGAVFVTLVTLVFLRRVSPSFIIISTIPFSIIVAFIFLYLGGYTINMMSLTSVAIAIGMVVDNAIVIVENVTTHLDRGVRLREAAIFGSSEVGMAISASTLTTVVIFVPLMFVPGMVGIVFRQLGAVVSITMLASLFTALTLTPILCSKYLKRADNANDSTNRTALQRVFVLSEGGFAHIEVGYRHVLDWTLRHRPAILFFACASFLIALLLVPTIGTEFFPEQDTGELSVTAELSVGTRVEETVKVAEAMRQMLTEVEPGAVEHSFFRAGESEGGIASAFGEKEGSHIALVGAKLVPILKRTKSAKEIGRILAEQTSERFPEITKLSVLAGSPIDNMILGNAKPITIEILGEDIDETNRVAGEIYDILANTAGAVDPIISRDMGKPQIEILIDRRKAASLGVNVAMIAASLRSYFHGYAATEFRERGDEYDIFVRLDKRYRQTIEDIDQVPIESILKKSVALSNIAEVRQTVGPVEIERKSQQRVVTVGADSFGRSVGQVYGDVERQIESKVNLPVGVHLETGGVIEEQMSSFRWLGIALVLGVVLVYMVMAAQFESLLDPFVILFAIPFSFVGVIVSLTLAGLTLNVVSLIGAVMLIGIVVNDAIVLVDYANLLRKRGLALMDAVRTASAQRLRPILLTTITTMCGMVPIAISRGEGSELWKPLGVTIIGGLGLATLVTLLIVPVLYTYAERWRQRCS